MKVCCISDIHGSLPVIDPCDLLVIAGDICPHAPVKKVTRFGTTVEYRPPVGSDDDMLWQARHLNTIFREWLDLIPAKYVVATPGNHDFIFHRAQDLVPNDLRWHVLIDAGKEIGGVKLYGSPWQHYYGGWAYNAPPRDDGGEEFLERKFSIIPDDTDVIIAHSPPYGLGDAAPNENGQWELTGSTSLMAAIMRVKPALSVHGHIHMGYGKWELERGNAYPTLVVNASICNERNEPVRSPWYFNI